MVAIEFKRVVKESLLILLVLLGLLVGILTTDKDAYLAPVVEIFLLLYASFTGWSIFDRERNEGAMEYLLSLPVSRTRLLLIKLLPRVVSLAVVLLVYILLHGHFQFPSLLPVRDFSGYYLAFFLVSLSLSLSIKSFIGAFFLTGLLSGGLTLLNRLIDVNKSDSSVFLQSNASLLIFPVLFFILFQTYDVRPTLSFNLKFAGLGTGAVILLVGISYIFTGINWCQYFLLEKGDIYRVSCGESQLLKEGKGVIQRYPACRFPLRPKGNSLYIQRKGESEFSVSLDLLDLETGPAEVLYTLPRGWWVLGQSFDSTGIIKDDKYYVLLGSWGEKKYRVLEIAKDRVKEIPVKGDLTSDNNMKTWHKAALVYVSANPLRFIISGDASLYSVDETGNAVELLKGEFLTAWNNRLLVFDKTGMNLWEIPGQGEPYLVFKQEGNLRPVRLRFGPLQSRKVLLRGEDHKKFLIFDLDDRNFEEIPLSTHPYFYLEKRNRMYLVWVNGDDISVGEWQEGKLVIKKEWKTPIKPIKNLRLIRVFEAGVIIFNRKEYETYWFESQ